MARRGARAGEGNGGGGIWRGRPRRADDLRDGRPPDEAELVAILGEHRRSSKPRSAALPQPAEVPPEQAKPWSAPPPQQQQRRPSMAQLTPMGAAGSTSPRSSRRSQRVKCNVQLPTVMKSNERTGRVASKSTRPWSLAGDLGGETSEDELSRRLSHAGQSRARADRSHGKQPTT